MLLLLALTGCVIHVLEDTCTFDGDVLRVEGSVGSGDLRVEAGDTLEVVRRLEYSGDHAPDLDATLVDGVLTLPGECDDLFKICSASWAVTLPAGAALDLATGSGNIEVRQIAGDARLETGSGNIDVTGGSGDQVVASAGSGDIDIDGDYADLDAEAGSGNVSIDAGDLASRIWLGTGSGDISARVAGGAWALDVDTGSGDTSISGVDDDSGSNRSLHAAAGSGNVEIRGR